MIEQDQDPEISGAKVVLFSLFLLFVLFLILEGFSYLVLKAHFGEFSLDVQGNSTMVESPYQVWEHPKKYSSWSGLTHFNNLGFRRFEDISEKSESDTIRIFIMGGSTAFGSQAMPGSVFLSLSGQGEYSSDKTISAYLEKLLQEKYPSRKFEVINAATNWSRIHQQFIHYLRKIRSLDPDLILTLDGQNDSHSLSNQINSWEDTQSAFEAKLLGNYKHKMRFLFKRSYTAYLMAMLIFRGGGENPIDIDLVDKYKVITKPVDMEKQLNEHYVFNRTSINSAVDDYVNNMVYFKSVLVQDSIPHAFFLQPLTIMDDTKKMTDRENAIKGYMYSRLAHQYFRINFFNKVVKEGEKQKAEHGVNFVNMTNMFDNVDEDVYSDYCHFTPRGNMAVAEYLLKYIERSHAGLLGG